MKHIPNILTLCNLLLGCMSIMFTLTAPTYFNTVDMEEYFPVMGVQQLEWGAICIFIAAIFDVLDGLFARILNAFSPIGKDLDSLADVVSFGVAPSMLLYQFIWFSYIQEPGAIDTPIWVTLPAFGVALFAALRLARFNVMPPNKNKRFTGLPVPAVGILVACIPLIALYQGHLRSILLNRTYLYIFIAVVCYLMVSKIPFVKWQGTHGVKGWLPQIIVAATAIIACAIFGVIGVYIAFVAYIIVSILFKEETMSAVE